MMMRWGEHYEKGVTDGRTDGQTVRETDGRTEVFSELLGRSLKYVELSGLKWILSTL